jgi:hypothetical protein
MMDDYHVFLTGYDDFELRVSEQTPKGFRVDLGCDRLRSLLLAGRGERKDLTAGRFETVTMPPEPIQPPIPAYGNERTKT